MSPGATGWTDSLGSPARLAMASEAPQETQVTQASLAPRAALETGASQDSACPAPKASAASPATLDYQAPQAFLGLPVPQEPQDK